MLHLSSPIKPLGFQFFLLHTALFPTSVGSEVLPSYILSCSLRSLSPNRTKRWVREEEWIPLSDTSCHPCLSPPSISCFSLPHFLPTPSWLSSAFAIPLHWFANQGPTIAGKLSNHFLFIFPDFSLPICAEMLVLAFKLLNFMHRNKSLSISQLKVL